MINYTDTLNCGVTHGVISIMVNTIFVRTPILVCLITKEYASNLLRVGLTVLYMKDIPSKGGRSGTAIMGLRTWP